MHSVFRVRISLQTHTRRVFLRTGMLLESLLYGLDLLWDSWQHAFLKTIELVKAAPCTNLTQPDKDPSHCLPVTGTHSQLILIDKCTKQQFIHLLVATCNKWHIDNSKNQKKVLSLTIHCLTVREYLINCHILLKYFELVFLQLQLVKITCKLIIIWVNYERKKKGSFFNETLCIYRCWALSVSTLSQLETTI